MYKVTSEIYEETNFHPSREADGSLVSMFVFNFGNGSNCLYKEIILDKDGDLELCRKPNGTGGTIEIFHSSATELKLVGLQVWRGALLLADYLLHKKDEFKNKVLLELGAGVGLTSIAASMFLKTVYCTDVDIGGILDLIRKNINRNKELVSGSIEVFECDFLMEPEQYSKQLVEAIDKSELVVAADVIYDDALTDAFIRVVDYIFARSTATKISKTVYIALEKRFVFTVPECDAVAPMFESFINKTMSKRWYFEYIPLDFSQYFQYRRCQNLVLIKLTCDS